MKNIKVKVMAIMLVVVMVFYRDVLHSSQTLRLMLMEQERLLLM